MSDRPYQLSLWDGSFSDIRRQTHEGKQVLSLVDIMSKFSDLASDGDVLWGRTKKRLIADGFQLDQKVIRLKMKARDGKMRLTEAADLETCLRIVQTIPSAKAEPIREWMAGLAVERGQEIANPELIHGNADKRYVELQIKRGMTQDQALQALQDRRDGKRDFRLLCAAIDTVCEAPQYGKVVNAEYTAMFGEIAANLREILNTKSIRDALPPMQYSYIRSAELSLQELFRQQDRMSMTEILEAVDEIAVPLGSHLRNVCTRLRISHITGQPLIGGAR